MTQYSYNRIQFCSVKSLCLCGFSRSKADKMMQTMRAAYKKDGYITFNGRNMLPINYAQKWVKEHVGVDIVVEKNMDASNA